MAFESQKETRNEGMEAVEAASEIILLLSLLGISGMAEQASDAMDRGCEKVKNGVRDTYETIKSGVRDGLNTLREGAESSYEWLKDGIDYINPFTLNDTLNNAGQKVDPEAKEQTPIMNDNSNGMA